VEDREREIPDCGCCTDEGDLALAEFATMAAAPMPAGGDRDPDVAVNAT
jgi:hypothetical protein